MKKFLMLSLSMLAVVSQAQTTFVAGDLAIVGYNSSNPDDVAIVSLIDFTAGTTFYMTDYGWRAANDGWRGGGEGWIKLTATRDYAAGEVFVVRRENAGATPPIVGLTNADFTYDWDGGATPEFAPNGSGDQVFLFQGDFTDSNATATPATLTGGSIIFGLNAEGSNAGANGWQADATGSQNSALPNTLVEGTTAVGLFPNNTGELANAAYNRVLTSGTREELLAAIANRSNWTTNASLITFDTTAMTVTPVPEPGTMIVLGLGIASLIRRRKA